MLSEHFFTAITGPPIAPNTAVSKDVGIYQQALDPSYGVKVSFKKSAAPPRCLAVSDTHVFAAQDQKAHVHVYSRARGNQEALVPFPERIRSIALAGQVLVLGTAEGRLILWETCTGRQVATPPSHVQAVSCLAVTPFYVISGSDDSEINVWSLARLLELDVQTEPEPERALSHHRGAITALSVGPGVNPETSICVSSSRDKTCIVWNYQSGHALRTLLFSSPPLCASLDPAGLSIAVACEDGAVYLIELFGEKALLGARSAEISSIAVQVQTPLGVADTEAGAPTCVAMSYDGSRILTGHSKGRILQWTPADGQHPVELTNLNACVTNLVFVSPFSDGHGRKAQLEGRRPLRQPGTLVKPNLAKKGYTVTTQLVGDLIPEGRVDRMLNAQGFSDETLEAATRSFYAGALSEKEEQAEVLSTLLQEHAHWLQINPQ